MFLKPDESLARCYFFLFNCVSFKNSWLNLMLRFWGQAYYTHKKESYWLNGKSKIFCTSWRIQNWNYAFYLIHSFLQCWFHISFIWLWKRFVAFIHVFIVHHVTKYKLLSSLYVSIIALDFTPDFFYFIC